MSLTEDDVVIPNKHKQKLLSKNMGIPRYYNAYLQPWKPFQKVCDTSLPLNILCNYHAMFEFYKISFQDKME